MILLHQAHHFHHFFVTHVLVGGDNDRLIRIGSLFFVMMSASSLRVTALSAPPAGTVAQAQLAVGTDGDLDRFHRN